MWLPIVLLFLVVCQTSISVGLYNEENVGFRSHLTRAEFGERIRDWFKNLKDRLFGRKLEFGASEEKDAMNLDKTEMQDRVRDSGGFFVDLSKLMFDPVYDIGFRIGRWYFIRMGDRGNSEFGYNDSNEWDISASLSPDQVTQQLSNDGWSSYEYTKVLNTTFLPTTEVAPSATDQATTESGESESVSTGEFKHEEDNETGYELDPGSVQVLFP